MDGAQPLLIPVSNSVDPQNEAKEEGLASEPADGSP